MAFKGIIQAKGFYSDGDQDWNVSEQMESWK